MLFGLLAAPVATSAQVDLSAPLSDAQAALAEGDHKRAYALYLRQAESGNPLAAFSLGTFLRAGWGRPVDNEQACRWFERAAEGSIPAAAHFFADCLLRGDLGNADPARAAQWYARAAELGHHGSLCALADLYMTGNGVERNPGKGLALCQKAAQLGSRSAAVKMGRYLLDGEESIRDADAAHAWFETVAHGSPEARFQLGRIHRDGIGAQVSPDQARHWFESAASHGYVPAYYPTAQAYLAPYADLATNKPPAGVLAKGYMWLRATQERTRDPTERAAAERRLEQVRAIMPDTWRPDLDARVAAHLRDNPALY